MRPIEIACETWEKTEKEPFAELVVNTLRSENGIVHSTPYSFLCASAHKINGKNTWFIELVAGSPNEMMQTIAQSPLPYIAFFRRGKTKEQDMKVYRTETLFKKMYAYTQSRELKQKS